MSELHPDKQLVFFKLDPTKGKGDELARVVSEDANGVREVWKLSPDGNTIALATRGEGGKPIRMLSLADGKTTVWPISQRQFVIDLGWAADSKYLFLTAQLDSSVVIASMDSKGAPTTLYKPASDQTWIGAPIASPDGHFLAFTQRSYVSDLVLVEKF
jgi:Tol biopolymer transport system component